MSDTKIHYYTVSSRFVITFDEKINKKLDQGYFLYVNPYVIIEGDHSHYTQAMINYVEKPDE